MKTIIERPVKKWVAVFAAAFLVTVGSGDAMAVSFFFTDASITRGVDQVTNTVSGSNYYGYNTIDAWSANTIDGLEDSNTNLALFFMYENTSTGDISLGLILDQPNDGSGGSMQLELSGIPLTGVIEVMDDSGGNPAPGAAVSGSQDFSWVWWACCTRGMMLGGLGGEWDITVTVDSAVGIYDWRFVDYTDAGVNKVPLDMSDGSFTISATATVPEPSTLLLLGSGLIGLGFFRRKIEIA